ncbi:hypothetical protein JD969_09150 [Planctomycetota bacterium]|nr:hypothetical protein JD969_09150 [Planctomycetota bacterium]
MNNLLVIMLVVGMFSMTLLLGGCYTKETRTLDWGGGIDFGRDQKTKKVESENGVSSRKTSKFGAWE